LTIAFELHTFDSEQKGGRLQVILSGVWPVTLNAVAFRGFLGPIEICQALRHLGFHTSPDEILDWLEVRALGDGWMG
jgi:hypothetical protein